MVGRKDQPRRKYTHKRSFDLLFATPITMTGFSGIPYEKSLQYRELFQRNCIAGIFNIRTSIPFILKN